MAVVEFTVSDDLARRIKGFFDSGCPGEIALIVDGRRVERVRITGEYANATSVRRFLPTASGVYAVNT